MISGEFVTERAITQRFPRKRLEDTAKTFEKVQAHFARLGSPATRDLTNMPSKNSRPGLGRLNNAGFEPTAATVSIRELTARTVEVSLVAPEGATFGRPLSKRPNHYGRPDEADTADQYRQMTAYLTPDWVPTQMYGERPDGTWEVFDGLEQSASTYRAPDAAIFIDVCVSALGDKKGHTQPAGPRSQQHEAA